MHVVVIIDIVTVTSTIETGKMTLATNKGSGLNANSLLVPLTQHFPDENLKRTLHLIENVSVKGELTF